MFDPVTKAIDGAAPGRILQAIEPEPEDRFAALEAERAPKRRGRKPGSKNKPKIAAGDDWLTIVPKPRPTPADRSATAGAYAPIGTVSYQNGLGEAEPDNVHRAEAHLAEALDDNPPSMVGPARGRAEKPVRRREGLRPGERWKRRLPKVAW